MDPIRRDILAMGAAATAVAAAPRVFAQQSGPGAAISSFYEKGNVRIRYQEAGSGFPLLVTPGGGLNSRMGGWPTAVINAMEVFKNDFRCITMDQRNASGGESTGPIAVDDPWGAFADDQLGLMDHLGIRRQRGDVDGCLICVRIGVVGEHQHRGLAGAYEVARHAVHEVGPDAIKVV